MTEPTREVDIWLPDSEVANCWEIEPGSGIVGRVEGDDLILAYQATGHPLRDETTFADRLHLAHRKLVIGAWTPARAPDGWMKAGRYDPVEGEVVELNANLWGAVAGWLGYLGRDPVSKLELETTIVPGHVKRRSMRRTLSRPDAQVGSELYRQVQSFAARHGHRDVVAGPRAIRSSDAEGSLIARLRSVAAP